MPNVEIFYFSNIKYDIDSIVTEDALKNHIWLVFYHSCGCYRKIDKPCNVLKLVRVLNLKQKIEEERRTKRVWVHIKKVWQILFIIGNHIGLDTQNQELYFKTKKFSCCWTTSRIRLTVLLNSPEGNCNDLLTLWSSIPHCHLICLQLAKLHFDP